MRVLGHDNPDASEFLKTIPRYVDNLRSNETDFFIIVDDAWIRAIVSLHQEPYFFFAPSGSTLGRLVILNPDLAFIDEVLETAEKLVHSEGLSYLLYSSSLIPTELIQKLDRFGFKEIDHAYSMFVDLDNLPEKPEGITFRPMIPSERTKILEIQSEFFSGTGDSTTTIIQENLLTLSEDDLDSMFNEDTTFLAMENENLVGIVAISIERGLLMSIAVSPEHRGKNIAKKMLSFALIRLKELGWGRVYLRVHTGNTPAIKLYDSFGFEIETETISYVYYPTPES